MKRFKSFILSPFRWLKHAYQRVRYGFSYRDVWNIDFWFLEVVPNMLEELANTTIGYPYDSKVYEENPEMSQEQIEEIMFNNWKDKLRKIAEYLREANEPQKEINQYWNEYYNFEEKHDIFLLDSDDIKNKLTEEELQEYERLREKWFKRSMEIEKYKQECLNKGLEMFSENFMNLWD